MHSTQENKVEQLLSIEDLSVEFISGENVQRAVNNINFSINKGETLALVGESGSGKSVTAHSILRLLPYPLARHPSGKIIYQGKDLLAAAPVYFTTPSPTIPPMSLLLNTACSLSVLKKPMTTALSAFI